MENNTNRSSSRSRRYYYYENDYDTRSPNKHPRHHNHRNHHNNHRNNNRNNNNNNKPLPQENNNNNNNSSNNNLMVTTTYRILCHDVRASSVLAKSGPVIKSIRQHTGASIHVLDLVPGDDERVIEISDIRRRDPDGRMPSFSPAQEALFLIHEKILECEAAYGGWGMEEEGGNRAVTRMVVSRMHVGSLLGKGGKIIEQMRMETKTHIRVLPRDHMLPRCIAMSEEIVQVVGDMNNVKNAIAIISSRLRESQHRDRSNSQTHGRDGSSLYNRANSPERFFSHEDEYIPHINNTPRRYESYPSRPSGFGVESVGAHIGDNGPPISGDDIVFRILCPIDRVESVVGGDDGFFELLQQEVGVDVKVVDRVAGSNEQIVIISSNEGPDDDLFPAQEALLHIQTRIVDLFPDKENVITTRLLVPSGEVGCLDGKDGSLSEMKRLTGASVQILPRDELPVYVSGSDEIVQIVGEIKAAREAVLEVTSRLKSFICQEFARREMSAPSFPAPSLGPNVMGAEGTFFHNDPPAVHQLVQPAKEFGGSFTETVKQPEKERLNKISMPLVTRSILEVVLPEYAVSKLSKNKLSQISELSGANVKLVEDGPEVTEKVIQISGTPEQAERAQSLLQGFILSTQD